VIDQPDTRALLAELCRDWLRSLLHPKDSPKHAARDPQDGDRTP
jgi:hypothetical protein